MVETLTSNSLIHANKNMSLFLVIVKNILKKRVWWKYLSNHINFKGLY